MILSLNDLQCDNTKPISIADSCKTKKYSGELGLAYTPFLNYAMYGFGLAIKYHPTDIFGTGGYLNYFFRKPIMENFGYAITQPEIKFAEIGWINQLNLITKGKVKLNINLSTGMLITNLLDAGLEGKHLPNGEINDRDEDIDTDLYLTIQPGADISWAIDPGFWITLTGKYRFVVGGSDFGRTNQYANYTLFLGFTVLK